MASALRADAPDFVPSFGAVSICPPKSRNSGPKGGPKRHRRRKQKKDNTSRSRRNQLKNTPNDQRPEHSVRDDVRAEKEDAEMVAPPTSFASILRSDAITSDAGPKVPAGWTVLRPQKQQRESNSKVGAVDESESRLTRNGPTTAPSKETTRTPHLTERMQKLRRRLWETMDRVQQEKRLEEEIPPNIQQDSSPVGMGVHDHIVVHAPAVPNCTRTSPTPTQPPLSFDVSSDVETMISQLQEGILPSRDEDYRRCLDVAVRLDRPQIVRLLCSHWVGSSYGTAKKKLQKKANGYGGDQEIHPLLKAVAFGHDECLQILLSSFPVGSICDAEGNTALHIAARRGNLETFRLVWRQQCQQTNKKKYHQAAVFKLVSRRNSRGQTYLHVACESSATDIVDWILRRNEQRSLLSKLLLMEDEDTQTPLLAAIAAGATDCVMNFLMQRAAVVTGSQSCPLRWAVRSNSDAAGVVDMVFLLLEFHGKDHAVSSSVYDWHGALCDCLARRDNEYTGKLSLQLLRLLIEAGANLFASSASPPRKARSAPTYSDSAFWMAVERYDAEALEVMLETHDRVETRRREMRRKDPKLKQQPESFFVGMESSSDLEKRTNLRKALLASLYHMQEATSSSSKETRTVAVLALYKHGATLDESHLRLLKESLRRVTLSLVETPRTFLASLQSSSCLSTTRARGDTSSEWKGALGSLPWFNCSPVESYSCHSISNVSGESYHHVFHDSPSVLIKSKDKAEFLVHEGIFDEQCEKLAGAVRFAKASRPSGDSTVTVEVGLTAIQCRWLLEHLYSNSILTPLPDCPVECCDALLELCLVADEYLCWSLLQECEMRLLANSASFNACFCLDCLSDTASCLEILPANPGAGTGSASSFLINDQTVLNVLALLNELVDSPAVLDEVYFTSMRTNEGWREQPALRALSDLVTRYLLSHFGAVVKSAGWVSQICAPDDCDATREFGMLLNYCLEELNNTEATSVAKVGL